MHFCHLLLLEYESYPLRLQKQSQTITQTYLVPRRAQQQPQLPVEYFGHPVSWCFIGLTYSRCGAHLQIAVYVFPGLVRGLIRSAWASRCYVTYLSAKGMCILGTLFVGEQRNLLGPILFFSYPILAWCPVN